MFTFLGPALPSAVDKLGVVSNATVYGDWAEFELLRSSAAGIKAFSLQFIRGDDGIWRIDGM